MTATESRSWASRVRAQERAKNGIEAALQKISDQVRVLQSRGKEDALVDYRVQLRVDLSDEAMYESATAKRVNFVGG